MLEEELAKDNWDVGRIRVLFRALKIARPEAAYSFVARRFSDLTIFAKELCLLMDALEQDDKGCFDDMLDEIVDAILSPPAQSVQLIRTWLIEIFVRGIIKLPSAYLKKVGSLSPVMDRRLLLFIRGRCADKNYFRKHKTAVHTFTEFELPALVWGASCLPKDEFEKWTKAIKASFARPLGALFLKWATKNQTTLISRLRSGGTDLPE